MTAIPQDHGNGQSAKSKRMRNIRARLFESQDGKCFWCQRPMEMVQFRTTDRGNTKHNAAFASFEHLIPKSKGGIKGPSNIVLAHAGCNHTRGRKRWPHDPIYGPNAKFHYAKGKRVDGPPPPPVADGQQQK